MSLNKRDVERQQRAYKAYAAQKPRGAVPSITITNATTTGIYRGTPMQSPRADADQNLTIPSRGISKQITRAL